MAPPNDPYESHLQRAASLFESGEIVQAGQIWQAILKKSPNHEIARAGLYKVKLFFDARATQGGLVSPETKKALADIHQPPPLPATIQADALSVDDIPSLLEQGCTLYDSGLIEEALSKWNHVLTLEPRNTLARGYANGARRALGLEPLPDAPPANSPVASEEETRTLTPSPAETTFLPSSVQPIPDVPSAPKVLPTAPSEAPLPSQPAPASEELDIERLLRDGCTLYDMGEAESALRKWEQILTVEPNHPLAFEYVRSARKDLGLPPLEQGGALLPPLASSPKTASSAPQTNAQEEDALERMLRDAVQLYDMGMIEEAISKWEEILKLKPDQKEASEYLAMARRDQAAAPPASATPRPSPHPPQPPAPPPPPQPAVHPTQEKSASLEPLLREAEHLFNLQNFDGAAQAYQKILAADPTNGRALQGYQEAKSHANAKVQPIQESEAPVEEQTKQPTFTDSAPPEALTHTPESLRRRLDIEAPLRSSGLLPFLQSPKIVLGTLAGIVILILAIFLINKYKREAMLRATVANEKANAIAKVASASKIENLAENPDAIRQEARSALSTDPLRAYFRAQELIRLNPGDAAAAQIIEQAKAACSQAQPHGTLKDLDAMLQKRDLESAQSLVMDLLKQTPDDGALRARAARICLAMTQYYASKHQWDDAQDQLIRGRAMFPSDKSWQAKLAFLNKFQSLPASEQSAWVQLLD